MPRAGAILGVRRPRLRCGMAGADLITSPDGQRWRVRRRWSDRPVPNIWRRMHRHADELEDTGVTPQFGDLGWGFGDGWPGMLIAFAAIVIFVILIPVLGVALELIVLVVVLWSGLISRLLLGHPWVVEARNRDDGERSVAYAVKGFRRAGAAVDELKAALAADGPPERLSSGERTELPRPSREPIPARDSLGPR